MRKVISHFNISRYSFQRGLLIYSRPSTTAFIPHPKKYEYCASTRKNNKDNNVGTINSIIPKKRKRRRILVCGDGDLSFGASLAKNYYERSSSSSSLRSNHTSETKSCCDDEVEIIVSVLECEKVHNQGKK